MTHLVIASHSYDEDDVAVIGAPTRVECFKCGVSLWAAPPSVRLINDGAKVVCMACGLAIMGDNAKRGEPNVLASFDVEGRCVSLPESIAAWSAWHFRRAAH